MFDVHSYLVRNNRVQWIRFLDTTSPKRDICIPALNLIATMNFPLCRLLALTTFGFSLHAHAGDVKPENIEKAQADLHQHAAICHAESLLAVDAYKKRTQEFKSEQDYLAYANKQLLTTDMPAGGTGDKLRAQIQEGIHFAYSDQANSEDQVFQHTWRNCLHAYGYQDQNIPPAQ